MIYNFCLKIFKVKIYNLDSYYADRQNDKVLLLHFWCSETAERVVKKLKNHVGNFNQFVID